MGLTRHVSQHHDQAKVSAPALEHSSFSVAPTSMLACTMVGHTSPEQLEVELDARVLMQMVPCADFRVQQAACF